MGVRYVLLGWFLLCLSVPIPAQGTFRILFWNVENLFDHKDDPHKNDNEFLPDAHRHWTYFRYQDKLNKLAKTIIASGREDVPPLVGLCEVENDTCLIDLLKHSPLREAGYRYIMTNSLDQRGIDVALLYQPGSFRVLGSQNIRIPHKLVRKGATRDILHVTGRVCSGDTLDIFVCHMPSRSGGKAKSEPYRRFTARILKHSVDSVSQTRKHPYIVVMGDFNDYPTDKSLKKELCGDGTLRNLMQGKKGGTYRYRGEWGILDQFLVLGTMLRRKANIHTSTDQAYILNHPFLLEEDDRYGGDKPFRTYQGMKYLGGYSDHLPICLDVRITRDGKDCYEE